MGFTMKQNKEREIMEIMSKEKKRIVLQEKQKCPFRVVTYCRRSIELESQDGSYERKKAYYQRRY